MDCVCNVFAYWDSWGVAARQTFRNTIMGVFPPNVVPEEILNDHPERLRAVLCSSSNPLRSYADTTAYEKAFSQLELLVTCELAMTETGRSRLVVVKTYGAEVASGDDSVESSVLALNQALSEIFARFLADAGARHTAQRAAAPE